MKTLPLPNASLTFSNDSTNPEQRKSVLLSAVSAAAVVAALTAPILFAVHARIVVPAAELTAANQTCAAAEAQQSARVACVRGILAQRHGTPDIAGR